VNQLMVVAGMLIGWFLCWITQASNRRTMDQLVDRHAAYTHRVLEESKQQGNLAGRVDEISQATRACSVAVDALEGAIEKLDHTVGNMLTSLVASGIIRTTGPMREKQAGEDPLTRMRMPSLFDRAADDVLIPPAGADELR
jgi:hypothetical protein